MSSRALRRLQAQKGFHGLQEIATEENSGESSDDLSTTGFTTQRGNPKNNGNVFSLLCEEDEAEENSNNYTVEQAEGTTFSLEEQGSELSKEDQSLNDKKSNQGARKKRKQKKKKKGKEQFSDLQEKSGDIEDGDDIEKSIREVNDMFGDCLEQSSDGVSESLDQLRLDTAPLLSVELRLRGIGEQTTVLQHLHRKRIDGKNLNPENELRRKFGYVARGERRRNDHRRSTQRSHWLIVPRASWHPLNRTGISMRCLEKKKSRSFFVFEHSSYYQKIQFQFMDAVESLDHNNIVALLNAHQYHIDSLLQLSEICKISEDFQMAAELIEKALYVLESAFHPLFNVTQGNCRLEYRRKENRALFIALFRHIHYVANRACYVTALEFCKLILSLSPEDDPLGIILLIDYFALKAEKYEFLIKFYKDRLLEDNTVVGLLPNFAFSIAMAMFFSTNGEDPECHDKLQKALITYPFILLPLMDKCGVTLDKEISDHPFFYRTKEFLEPVGVKALGQLFISRNFSLWKQSEVLDWVTKNCKEVLCQLQGDPSTGVREMERRREQEFYKKIHRPVDRHIILSEYKEAVALLPPHIRGQSLMTLDPLPPVDSVAAYSRPAGTNENGDERGLLSLFLRSLLPSYGQEPSNHSSVQPPVVQVDERQDPAGTDNSSLAEHVQDSVRGLVGALRQLLDTMTYRGDVDENDEDEQQWDEDGA